MKQAANEWKSIDSSFVMQLIESKQLELLGKLQSLSFELGVDYPGTYDLKFAPDHNYCDYYRLIEGRRV